MKPETRLSKSLSRRDALKALAALSGAAALSTVPNNWKKPLVEVGSLPAFAQMSQTIELVRMDASSTGEPPDDEFNLRICVASSGAVDGICRMDVTLTYQGGTSSIPVTIPITYDPAEGDDFCDDLEGLDRLGADSVQVCVKLYDCNYGFSNTLCDTVQFPD